MFKRWLVVLTLAAALPAKANLGLSATERTWLEAAAPVLLFARQQGLPMDIIVQPQPTPGQTPLGMAFVDGRCKLVLSMRGNPDAQATLDRIEPSLLEPVVEAIAAHELGHCWRHLTRTWGVLPAGMQDNPVLRRLPPEQADLVRELWRTRCEEGFADLVGLAWTLRQHPDRYAEVHAWYMRLRADRESVSGPHDTVVWLRLARDRLRFDPAASIFEQVGSLWTAGLRADVGALPERGYEISAAY